MQLPKIGSITLITLCLPACLFTPGNEAEVCGADANIGLAGYLPNASQTVTFLASTSPTGPFTVVGSAVSSSSVYRITGQDYYGFNTSLDVTDWIELSGQLSVYIKATTGSFNLLTFEAQNSAGQTGIVCVADRITNLGETASQAALACDRGDPVIRIDAPIVSTCSCTPTIVTGDLVVSGPRSAADARCATSVSGSLRVLDSAPSEVDLSALVSVDGDLEIHYEPPSGGGNRDVDLIGLIAIGGDVAMSAYRGLGSKTVDTHTDNVTSVGGNLYFRLYDNNLDAFPAVTSVTGDILIEGWSGATGNLDVSGGQLLPALDIVTGNLTLQGFFSTNSMFDSVTEVTGDVTINAVRFYPTQSFTLLETVGGDLTFQDLKGLGPNWATIQTVGGELRSIGNSMSSLSLLPVNDADVGGIWLEDNVNLATLDGDVQADTGGITISGSPSLSQCDVDTWLADQTTGGWTGTDSVSGTIACP